MVGFPFWECAKMEVRDKEFETKIVTTRRDPLTKRQRSRQMALVKSKNTGPELAVRRILYRLGYRYRLHPVDIPGRPDIVLRRHRKVIFVHGCFWHRHRGCSRTRTPKTRIRFWRRKFDQNVARDRFVRSALVRDGWKPLIVWECDSENVTVLERRLLRFLRAPL